MKRCSHNQWLSLCRQGYEIALLESDRLRTLLSNVTDPDEAKPGLIVFIGDRTKSITLEKAFGIKRRRVFRGRQYVGDINLHMAPGSELSNPLLIADSCVSGRNNRREVPRHGCHEISRWPLQTKPSKIADLDDLALVMHCHLLLPFTDVFCFFASDMGGFRIVARHLARWLNSNPMPPVPVSVRPRVVVVTDKIPPTKQREAEARKALLWLLREETTDDLFNLISAIDVVAISPPRVLGASDQPHHLKASLLRWVNSVQQNRVKAQTSYSLTHFAAFFESACQHFAQSSPGPFDFVKASRMQNPPASDLRKHLVNFLSLCGTPQDVTSFAAPIIASSFLLDSYPPGCHPFDPGHLFKAMYHESLRDALGERVISFQQSSDVILRTGVLNTVLAHLRKYFDSWVSNPEMSSASIHLTNLQLHEKEWCQMYSDVTCFCCISRTPQYRLPCGHLICENCVQIFGRSLADEPWIYRIASCFLCAKGWAKEIAITVDAPTRGFSLLCMDGGGTRGVVPLTLLKRLEDQIDLPIPVQRHFNFISGVSSGNFAAFGLYRKAWPPEKCIEMFYEFAKLSFEKEEVFGVPLVAWMGKAMEMVCTIAKPFFDEEKDSGIPFLSWMGKALRLYRRDGIYKAESIESVLKFVLGEQTILDMSYATEIGAKLCVLVATVLKQPSYRIFTNYNGVGQRGGKQEVNIIKPEEGANAPLWEIARAASAAPYYFPVKTIPDVGTFQDVGLLRNDPTAIAFSEARALYPSVEQADMILSLGTGSLKASHEDRGQQRSAVQRVYDLAWEKAKDCQVEETFRHIPRYHRLNPELDDEYSLDNTTHMYVLKSKVETDESLSRPIETVARRAIASKFYFELAGRPKRVNGRYIGTGHILCSILGREPAFEVLLKRLASSSTQLYLNAEPIPGRWDDPCCLDKHGNFFKRVQLSVVDRISISLRTQGLLDESYPVSGLPSTVDKLVQAQGLNAYFGTADHRKRKRPSSDGHEPKKRRCLREVFPSLNESA